MVAKYSREAHNGDSPYLDWFPSAGALLAPASEAFQFELDGLVFEADFDSADRLPNAVQQLTLKTGREIGVIELPAGGGTAANQVSFQRRRMTRSSPTILSPRPSG